MLAALKNQKETTGPPAALGSAFAIGLLLVLAACGWRSDLSSDASMEANFLEHRAQFEALVKMFAEDPQLRQVAPGFTSLMDPSPYPPNDIGISQARWDEYRKLFKNLGLEGGLVRREKPRGAIGLIAEGRGLAVAGQTKGYLFSPTEAPIPLVTSLDHGVPPSVPPPVPPHTAKLAFKEIEKNWYLFYTEE